MKSKLFKIVGILLMTLLIISQPTYAMYGPPEGTGGNEGGGEVIETLGNNLSVPVIFPENVGMKGVAPSQEDFRGDLYPSVNLTLAAICNIDLNGDKSFQVEEQNRMVYLQKTENTWQAQWRVGMHGNYEHATIDWGDNLVNKAWSINSKIRVENVMFTTANSGMFGYEMGWVEKQGSEEVWGTTGEKTNNLPTTIFSPNARLSIEKLDKKGGEPIYTVFNHAVWEGYGLEDSNKDKYSAEINVGGKVIYGYNWNLGGTVFPSEIPKDGWYRLTYSIDKFGQDINGREIIGNVAFDGVAQADGEARFRPVVSIPDENSDSIAISFLEIEVISSQGGGGPGGGSGGGDVEGGASISLDKDSETLNFTKVGDSIEYSYLVTNTGKAELEGPFTIEDDKVNVDTSSAPAILSSGESFTATATYTVKQEDLDIGYVTNTATANVSFGEGTLSSDEDSVTVDAVHTVMYTAENGTIEGEAIQLVNHGEDTVTVKAISNSGYYFAGWEDGNASAERSEINVTKDAVYNVVFKRLSTGGTGATGGTGTTGASGTTGGADSNNIPDEQTPLAGFNDYTGYMNGYPDGSMRPEAAITREETAAIFFRMLEAEYRERIRSRVSEFSDVEKERWSFEYIATLSNGKILLGYPDGKFRPSNMVTRAEMATITARYANLAPETAGLFDDTKGHWAERHINAVMTKGWFGVYSNGSFMPQEYVTRGDMMQIINEILNSRMLNE